MSDKPNANLGPKAALPAGSALNISEILENVSEFVGPAGAQVLETHKNAAVKSAEYKVGDTILTVVLNGMSSILTPEYREALKHPVVQGIIRHALGFGVAFGCNMVARHMSKGDEESNWNKLTIIGDAVTQAAFIETMGKVDIFSLLKLFTSKDNGFVEALGMLLSKK